LLCFKYHVKRYNDIFKEFEKYGSIKDIHIPLDFHSQKPKGYLFVEYEDNYQAQDAYFALNESKFYGKIIEIDFARRDWKRRF
jgi:RNA recognition motif-containing protein